MKGKMVRCKCGHWVRLLSKSRSTIDGCFHCNPENQRHVTLTSKGK